MFGFLRLLLINVLVLFTLMFSLNVSAVLVIKVWRAYNQSEKLGGAGDARAKLKAYNGEEWVEQHFIDIAESDITFRSYIGWERNSTTKPTVNIRIPGERVTKNSADGELEIWMFGGSAMWGTGSPDWLTIPSLVAAKMPNFKVRNFGESAYTSMQGLNKMIQLLLEGEAPEAIVFYDGGNDISYHCRSDLTPPAYVWEPKIRMRLNYGEASGRYDVGSFQSLVLPAILFSEKIMAKLAGGTGSADGFDCHSDPQKAAKVVGSLIQTWGVAASLAESNDAVFLGVLQPVAYIGAANVSEVSQALSPGRYSQFQAVYPILGRQIAEYSNSDHRRYLDFTKAFDGDVLLYIDDIHVTHNGNEIIANDLVQNLNIMLGGKQSDRENAAK